MKVTLTAEQSIYLSRITFINGESVTGVKYSKYFNSISFTNSEGLPRTLHISEIKEYVIDNKITVSPPTMIEGKLLAKFVSGNDDDLYEFLECKGNFCELSGAPTAMMAFCAKVAKGLKSK